jgi:ABC-type branched-subunit amino acid transport system substrate-binding protein
MRRRHLLATGASMFAAGWAPRAFAADAGVSNHEILIGQSAVLSGPLGVSLKAFNAGAALLFDELNARGGVHGRHVRLVSLDDGLKPDAAVANYKALLAQHNVFAFFGGVGSGTIAAATPVLRESNAPLIGNYALSDAVREKAQGAAYFVRATYGREAEKLVQHLDTIGISRIAVAHLANPGGDEVLALVRKAIAAQGKAKDVAASAAVKNDGTNTAECAKALAAANAQAVLMFISGPPVAELMKTIWAAGSNPSFYGMSVVLGDQVAKALGERMRGLAISQVVPYPWSDADATARGFRERCTAAKVEANYTSYEGYLNAMVLVEALRRAGPAPTRSAVHAAMHSLKTRVGGMDVDFAGDSATGSRFVDLVHVNRDGRFSR